MTTATTKIELQLYRDREIKELWSGSVEQAKELLSLPMVNRYRWRLTPPDSTGELPNDEARYAADCAACGVGNPFAGA